MDDVPGPGRALDRGTKLALVLAVFLVGLALAGVPRPSTAAKLGRYGVATQATIVGRSTNHGTRYATVQFPTAAGVTTTRIAICHHQAYDIGVAVPILYDSRAPAKAWERDMAPRRAPSYPTLALLCGLMAAVAGGLVLLWRRRRPSDPDAALAAAPTPDHEWWQVATDGTLTASG